MKTADDVQATAVVGNDLPGPGIAQVMARSGKSVALIGRNADSLGGAMDSIDANFAAFVERKLTLREDADAAIARISPRPITGRRGRPIS